VEVLGTSGEIAFSIVGIFLIIFAVMVATVLFFTRGMAKDKEKLEIKKRSWI
jgi:cytochrome bd-type quinol oxidase subunit 1